VFLLAPILFGLFAQDGLSRFRIELPGQVLDSQIKDADHDGSAELWFSILQDDRRRVVMYPPTGGGYAPTPAHSQVISRAVVSWAAGNFLADEGPELLLTTREAVYVQALGKRPKKIFAAPLLFDLPSQDALPILREVADLDGDGLDEVVLPTREGYQIIRGDGSVVGDLAWAPRMGRSPVAEGDLFGGLARPTLSSQPLSDLFVPEESAGIIESPPLLFTSIDLPRPVLRDLNGDGLIDLSFLDRGRVRVHLMDGESGLPGAAGLILDLPAGKALDDEELDWGDFGGGPEADLILVRSSTGIGVNYKWQIRVWLDVVKTRELGEPDLFRKVEGSWVSATMRDLNGDQRPELALSVWELSLGLTLREPQLSHQLLVFRAEEDGWSNRAAISSGRSYGVQELDSFAVVPTFPGDLDGDGRADVLQSSGQGELEIRPIQLGENAGIGEATQRIPVDALAAYVTVEDLNGDAAPDLIVRKDDHWDLYLSR